MLAPRHMPSRLPFEPAEGGTVDQDEAVLAPQLEQVKEKAKDLFSVRGGENG